MVVVDEPWLLFDRRLLAWRTTRPRPGLAFERQAQLLRESLIVARPVETQPFALPREHAAARVREGVPLLDDQPAHLDIRFASDLFGRLVRILAHGEDPEPEPRLGRLTAALGGGLLDPQRLFSEAFVRHADHLAEIAVELGVEPTLLTPLAELAAAPLLRAYAQRLLPLVARLDDGSVEGAVWQRGYCPVCGGWPALAEQNGLEPMLRMRCAGCGSGWRAWSQACPYCGNADPARLHGLTLDGEPGVSLAACDCCTGYCKVFASADASPPELVALDDAATGLFDEFAVERGYRRPASSGFRIELAIPEEAWLDEFGES